ncbi:MAG: hypothetical protein IJW51_01885 [Clostridia bacterium]|nr:hypothetical protein [Clostridia bacterium]
MKTVGFVDFYLDEWHANQYPAMIAAHNEQYGTDYRVQYAWAEIDAPPSGGLHTDEWCEKYGVERCATIEELCVKCDHVIVLAPADPEKHLAYAERVFRCGKSAYIDKTFAPDHRTAKEIFSLAEKYGVKCFSSSALRYAQELADYAEDALSVLTTGGGADMEEYIIHQIEMVVKCLGCGAARVQYSKHADREQAEVIYEDGRHATMLFCPCLPFSLTVAKGTGTSKHFPIKSAFFQRMIGAIIRFFETGETPFEPTQTLEIMRIREVVLHARREGAALSEIRDCCGT